MVTVEQILASEWPMSLDPEFDGGCPCCSITGNGFSVDVRCWRVSSGGSEILVAGLPQDLGQKVADHIRKHNGWSNHCAWRIEVTIEQNDD